MRRQPERTEGDDEQRRSYHQGRGGLHLCPVLALVDRWPESDARRWVMRRHVAEW